MNEAPTVYGIDLGTTFTKCAVIDPGARQVRTFELDEGRKSIQSIVGLRQENGNNVAYVGAGVIGELEFPDLELGPVRVVEEAKRWMGRLSDPKGINDPPPWDHGGWDYVPQDVGAIILRKVCKEVDPRMPQDPVARVVITHPQKFTDNQRMATIQAGQIAGLNVVTSITEPDAAMVFYGADREPGVYMVFDCGGGTLDVTIARVVGPDRPIEVITSEGLYKGGRELDRCILDILCEQYAASFRDFDRKVHLDKPTTALWLKEAREIKERLSRGKDRVPATIMVHNQHYQGGQCGVRVSRAMFQDRIKGLLTQFKEIADRALEIAHLRPADIKQVLLVGGTSRLPELQRLLEMDPPVGLGARLNRELDPTTAVCQGAAFFAHEYIRSGRARAEADSVPPPDEPEPGPAGGGAALTLQSPISSTLAHGLGIKVSDGTRDILHIMVPKDTRIPHQQQQTFYTSYAGATSIPVELFEGNTAEITLAHELGACKLTGIPAGRPAGQPVEVKIIIAHNGQKRIRVRDLTTNKWEEMDISHDKKAVVDTADIEARRRQIMSLVIR